jgi:hypothetical protein
MSNDGAPALESLLAPQAECLRVDARPSLDHPGGYDVVLVLDGTFLSEPLAQELANAWRGVILAVLPVEWRTRLVSWNRPTEKPPHEAP